MAHYSPCYTTGSSEGDNFLKHYWNFYKMQLESITNTSGELNETDRLTHKCRKKCNSTPPINTLSKLSKHYWNIQNPTIFQCLGQNGAWTIERVHFNYERSSNDYIVYKFFPFTF